MRTTLLLLLAAFTSPSFAQNIGIGTNTPAASAKLEINSTNSGLLAVSYTHLDVYKRQPPYHDRFLGKGI